MRSAPHSCKVAKGIVSTLLVEIYRARRAYDTIASPSMQQHQEPTPKIYLTGCLRESAFTRKSHFYTATIQVHAFRSNRREHGIFRLNETPVRSIDLRRTIAGIFVSTCRCVAKVRLRVCLRRSRDLSNALAFTPLKNDSRCRTCLAPRRRTWCQQI